MRKDLQDMMGVTHAGDGEIVTNAPQAEAVPLPATGPGWREFFQSVDTGADSSHAKNLKARRGSGLQL